MPDREPDSVPMRSAAVAVLCALVVLAGVPGGMGFSFDPFRVLVVLVAFLGVVVGYFALLFTAINRALRVGPRRTFWRISASLLALGGLALFLRGCT